MTQRHLSGALAALLTLSLITLTGCSPAANLHDRERGVEPQAQAEDHAPLATSTTTTARFGGWTMPQPGTFDPDTPDFKIFKACEEIPGEVFEELGFAIRESDDFEPYSCIIQSSNPDWSDAAIQIGAWKTSTEAMLNSGMWVIADDENKTDGLMLRNTSMFEKARCDVVRETTRGTIVVSYLHLNEVEVCPRAAAIYEAFMSGGNNED